MKRILAILLIIFVLFFICSCSLVNSISENGNGYSSSSKIKCSDCDKYNPSNAKYCSNCGADMRANSGSSNSTNSNSTNSNSGNTNSGKNNDKEKEDPKLLTMAVVRTNGVSYCDGKTSVYRMYEYIYDEEGNLKEENTYIEYSPITARTELIEKKEYYKTSDPNVVKYGRIFYSYSAYENAYYKDTTETCYDVYNDDGVKLYTTSTDPILLKSMIVNEDENCLPKGNWNWDDNPSQLEFHNKLFPGFDTMRQKVIDYSDGTQALEKTLYKNNEMIGFYRMIIGGDEHVEYHVYENGNIVKTFYNDGEHDVFLKYSYRYDAEGNCIERKQYVDVAATMGDVGVPNSNGVATIVRPGGGGISVDGLNPFNRDSYGNTDWIGPSIYEDVDYDVYTDVYTNTYVKLSKYEPPSPTTYSGGGSIKSGASASGNSSGSVVCLHCKQSGYMECLFCDGTGKVLYGFKDNGEKTYRTCTYCSGGGFRKCAYCGGDGYFRD